MKIIRKKTEELKLFTNQTKIYKILITVVILGFTFQSYSVNAQHRISFLEEQLFKREALTRVNELVYVYNQLLETPSYERDHLIKELILPKDGLYAKFKDDQVQIEDDFQTRQNSTNESTSKRIDIYLNDICLNYGMPDNGAYKNEGKKVTIKNAIPSKVMAISDKAPMFIKVSFSIEYNGIDSRTNLPFKQPCNRVAEVLIEKVDKKLNATILTIRYLKDNEKDFSENVVVDKVDETQNKELAGAIIEEEKKTILKNNNTLLRAFKNNEKWGIKNVETDEILVLPTFDSIDEFSEDDGISLVNINGLWGYIDQKGTIIIKCEYDEAEPFSKEKKGKARVYKGKASFFIDRLGNKTK